MELSIEEMKKSIAEPRPDHKVSPKVGAVLVNVADKAPGYDRIMKAHRGELRNGDHAEFTLLERKHRDRLLSDCYLFATLEPCAPGARKQPKLGCAERIVLARIKKVWIGIEDPDPTVDRKGIKYLQDNGIEVEMFDRDLQDIVRAENQQFLDQALERADEARGEPERIVLSTLESPKATVDWSSLSQDALRTYQERAQISEPIDSDTFVQRLERQGLLVDQGGVRHATGFGNILFGVLPRESTPQAAVLATIHYANGQEEGEDFDGPQALVPEKAMDWLENKLPNVMDRSGAVRKVNQKVISTLVREGLVNAIVHRDYELDQAKIQLVVRPSHIEILSPGKPVSPITLEQMQSFDAPMLSRNPVMHFVFAKMKLAEERGLGLKSLREQALASGLPKPKYDWRDPYLALTIFLTPESAVSALSPEVLEALSETERRGWQWLASVGSTVTNDYAEHLEVTSRTARRHLNRFVELEMARKTGSGNSTKYEVE